MSIEQLKRDLKRADDAMGNAIDKLCFAVCLVVLFTIVGKLWVFGLVMTSGWALQFAINKWITKEIK